MIRKLFNTPSSFESDALGFSRNAAGHVVIVGALPAYLLPEWCLAALVLYAIWEAAQWLYRDAELWDCLHDTAYVFTGALAVSEPLAMGPLLLFYSADIIRRL